MVQHAGIRFACKFDSIGDVGLSIPQIQNLSLVGMGRGRGFEFSSYFLQIFRKNIYICYLQTNR